MCVLLLCARQKDNVLARHSVVGGQAAQLFGQPTYVDAILVTLYIILYIDSYIELYTSHNCILYLLVVYTLHVQIPNAFSCRPKG